MGKPASERCREYVPRPPKPEKNAEGFGKKPPKPPKKAPKSMTGTASVDDEALALGPELPAAGTAQRAVLEAFRGFGERGGTDAEVALKVERERRDVVALRTELVQDGLLWDSGLRRRDTKGNEGVAWTALPMDALPEPTDSTPMLVRDDVSVEQSGRAVILHAGSTAIRLTGVPGDLVEVRTTPPGADHEQAGGPEVTLLLVVEGSEEMYDVARNPFTTPADVMEVMSDIVTPATSALTAVRKDL